MPQPDQLYQFIFFYSNTNEGRDFLPDFSSQNDFIIVSASGFGGGLESSQSISSNQFVIGNGARDSNDRFIYNSNNGDLFFDHDGNGPSNQILIATLNNTPNLTRGNIFIVV